MRVLDMLSLLIVMLDRALQYVREDAPEDVVNMRAELDRLRQWRDEEIAAEWKIVREG